jgi:hypothetical protein
MVLQDGTLAFASHREFIQYLARNPDAARQRPKPLTLREALALVRERRKALTAEAGSKENR